MRLRTSYAAGAAPSFRAERWHRPLLVGLTGGLLGLVVLRAVTYAMQPDAVVALLTNADHRIYMDAADRIRAGGPLYPAWQLAGPYGLDRMPELYPPQAVYLLIVPMSFLPDVLWWAIPIAIIAATVWDWRPPLLGWAGILACFAPPWAWDGILAGGVFLWVAAFVALGTRWPVFYLGALAKPSLFPFALLGIRSRWWWAGVTIAAASTIALLPAWLDYARVMTNLREGGLLYSVHNVPLLLVPLLARLTSSRTVSASLPR